jgi:hypothetical protein
MNIKLLLGGMLLAYSIKTEEFAMSETKTVVGILLVGVMSVTGIESTEAALIDRGNGLIYDTVLDVTWVQDVALARTLGQDSDGRFDWYGANAWVNQLVYAGYDDWRLPTLTPINGISFNSVFHCDGSADYGYGIAAPGGASAGFTGNELAYMYHVNLGNQSRCTGEGPFLAGKEWGPDVGVQNASFADPQTGEIVSFLNLEDIMRSFWTDYVPVGTSPYTWLFKYSGFNDWAATSNFERAWAVRDGDVVIPDNKGRKPPRCKKCDPLLSLVSASTASVPEPGTLPLMGGSLLGLWVFLKRKAFQQRFTS